MSTKELAFTGSNIAIMAISIGFIIYNFYSVYDPSCKESPGTTEQFGHASSFIGSFIIVCALIYVYWYKTNTDNKTIDNSISIINLVFLALMSGLSLFYFMNTLIVKTAAGGGCYNLGKGSSQAGYGILGGIYFILLLYSAFVGYDSIKK